MAEGRSRASWDHTSHVLCLLANVNRDPKKSKAYRPADFHPHETKAAPKSRLTIAELRDQYGALLTGQHLPGPQT
jgi:hypothetical protein